MSIEAEAGRVKPPAARRLFAAVAAFVVAVAAVRFFRAAVLFQLPDLSWLAVWLAMWAATLAAAAAAFFLAARAFAWFEGTPAARRPLGDLPFRTATLLLLALAALAAGVALRLGGLPGRSPTSLLDDLTLLRPTLDLSGTPRDLERPLRAAPYGVEKPFATVGVLYLEVSRASLRAFGTTLEGIRLPAALFGSLSLVTGTLLGRALLPRGGGTLVALVLAGLRWALIVSRWSWAVSIAVAPLVDVATLLLLRARRKRSLALAAAAGLVAGLGAHAYLVAWVAGAALAVWALAPGEDGPPLRVRAARGAAFAAAFLLAAAPLFRAGGAGDPPYFARTGAHNVLREIRVQKSVLPLFGAAADALAAPWFVPDPAPWGDLPGKSRTGLVLGTLLAVGLGRALLSPKAELSSLLLAHAGAGFASAVLQGESGNPNGYRYVYLTVPAALAIASGALALVGSAPARHRRAAALALVGAVAVAGVLGARDACLVWPEARATFTQFRGCGTLLGEAAHRWSRYGRTTIPGEKSDTLELARLVATWGLVRGPEPEPGGGLRRAAAFRAVLAPAPADARVVERVVTPWNEACGAVLLEPDVLNGGRESNAP
jgi:hypothetical protein